MDNFLLWMWIWASKAPKIGDIQDLTKKNVVMREFQFIRKDEFMFGDMLSANA